MGNVQPTQARGSAVVSHHGRKEDNAANLPRNDSFEGDGVIVSTDCEDLGENLIENFDDLGNLKEPAVVLDDKSEAPSVLPTAMNTTSNAVQVAAAVETKKEEPVKPAPEANASANDQSEQLEEESAGASACCFGISLRGLFGLSKKKTNTDQTAEFSRSSSKGL